ncbi:MAG: S-methyl-5-thioribose-1-phosphate isomerase [Deferribacteraceae bacterium]|jgi:methylthioribose-1-phosphate isomerase|nr:S-methyl-5-thioribose-1-phosphate isomerase [Deferribacteraceae bacterium]
MNIPESLYWRNNELYLLDQRLLPAQEEYIRQSGIEDVWCSINTLAVRGAPAIGIAAAYGSLTGLHKNFSLSAEDFGNKYISQAEYLITSRPTAVNLSYTLNIMINVCRKSVADSAEKLYTELEAQASALHNEDIEMNRMIGVYGAELISNGCRILTHCNAGAMASTGIGTALAPVYTAHKKGIKLSVYADETRPLLQGARITVWELMKAGVETTLVCDNMAADLMSRGMVDLVIVGCDRVAANGDTANKIGTHTLAVTARHFGIPFYIAAPSSSIDQKTVNGAGIIIEQRAQEEVTAFGVCITAPDGVKVYNPSFDVTPNSLITGFITEKGRITPPYDFSGGV